MLRNRGLLILFVMILGLVLVPGAFAMTASRQFSNANPAPGSTVNITITAAAPIDIAYGVVEDVPAGFTILQHDSDAGVSGQTLSWAFIDSNPRTLWYTIQAPSTTGTYDFSGTYAEGALGTTNPISGQTSMVVSGTPPSTTQPDTTPPILSGITAVPSTTSSQIRWNTDESSTTIVYYGTTSSLGQQNTVSGMSTTHSLTLSGLANLTTYNYKVSSCDALGNCANSSLRTFTTVASASVTNDDLNVNYIRGKLILNGQPAAAGTEYRIIITSGNNAGKTYTGRVDDTTIPQFLKGQGYFDTGDQTIFSTGSQFRIDGSGYSCASQYIGTFQNGGNGDFSSTVSLIEFDCSVILKHPPRIESTIPDGSSVTLAEGSSVTFEVTATDEDGDLPLAYSYTLDGVEVSTSSVYAYAPDYESAGTHSVVVNVTDSTGMYATAMWSVQVTNVNRNPTLTIPDILPPALEGTQYEYELTAMDPDTDDSLTFASNSSLFTVTNSANKGLIRFTPTNNQVGAYSINITVSDGKGGQNSKTVILNVQNVNDAPILNAISNKIAYQAKELRIQLSASDIDRTNDTLTYFTNATFGTLNTTSGLFTYTPDITTKGVFSVQFGVTDGMAQDTKTVVITVKPVLELTSVTATVDGEMTTLTEGSTLVARPDSEVTLTSVIKNNFDEDIYGVDFQYDINGLAMTGKNMANIIPAGTSSTRTVSFTMPTIVDEGAYPMTISAKDMDSSHNEFNDMIHVILNLSKEENRLLIENMTFSSGSMLCVKDNQVTLTIANIGAFDIEDANLTISEGNLGINVNDYIGHIDRNTRITKTYTITPALYVAGNHNVQAKLDYFFVRRETKTASLEIRNCSITNISPDPSKVILITEDGSQPFSMILPSGITADWLVDGVPQVSGSSYIYVGDGNQGRYNHTIVARVDGVMNITWHLVQTSYPITDTFGGDTTDFSTWTEFELRHAYGIIFDRPGIARITIPGPVDVSDITTFDGRVILATTAAGIDTNALPMFSSQVGIVEFWKQQYTDSPVVRYSYGFTSNRTLINQTCDFCNVQDYSASPTTNGYVRFDAEHFTVFGVLSNTAPSIISSAPTLAYVGEEYAYNARASDAEGDAITYSLSSSPSGMTITSAGAIRWTPSGLGTFNASVVATDAFGASSSQSFIITVSEAPRMSIRSIKAEVDGNKDTLKDRDTISDEAKPGSKLKLQVEVCNDYTRAQDLKIEDVSVTSTISNIDDGDDLEDETDQENINADDCKKFDQEFDIPTTADEDDYDILVQAEGDGPNRTKMTAEWIITLQVQRDKHDMRASDFYFSPSTISCEKSATMYLTLENFGQDTEDKVSYKITNDELGISLGENELEIDTNTDTDNNYQKSYAVHMDNVSLGTYAFTVQVYYDSILSDTKTVDLVVGECRRTSRTTSTLPYVQPTTTLPSGAPVTNPTPQETALLQILPKAEPVKTVVRAPAYVTYPAAYPVAVTTGYFSSFSCFEYTVFLVMLIIIVAGLIIYLAGVLGAMKGRKTRMQERRKVENYEPKERRN